MLFKEFDEKTVKKESAHFINPMLAVLTDKYFSDKQWIYEKKLDGMRCIIVKNGNNVSLYSRSHRNLNHAFPELIPSIKKQKWNTFVMDGEIVAAGGPETFERLQKRLNVKDIKKIKGKWVKVRLYVFDILHLEGFNLTKMPLIDRKSVLKKALKPFPDLKYLPHKRQYGEKYLAEACKKGWEGIIAKKATSTYISKRSTDWLKFKCSRGQEFIICGFTDPNGSRIGFGALLLGYYDKGKLKYGGKVGTGYDEETLSSLSKQLRRIQCDTSPFEIVPYVKGVHWTTPTLVCEVGFTEWTRDGKLRHPRYLGLRIDKKAKDVTREGK